jgi:hypothetical protein
LTPPPAVRDTVVAALARLPAEQRPLAAARMLLELDDELAASIPDGQTRLRCLLRLFATIDADVS